MPEAKSDQVEIAPELLEWQDRSLTDLARYIIAKHHRYLRQELPMIEPLLGLQKGKSDPVAGSLMSTFSEFRRLMENHMQKEETILFPMIGDLESARDSGEEPPALAFGTIEHPIAIMEEEHEQARKELKQMHTLTNGYTTVPGIITGDAASVLGLLKALHADMEIHSRLEDDSLFPRAIGLERG